MKSTICKVDILDIPFAKLSQGEALDILESWLDETKNHVIVTPNPEGVMQARRNPEFKSALQNAELSLADGTGILLASYFSPRKLPGRVRGVDTIFSLFERLSANGKKFTVYFLGAAQGVPEAAKINMESRFPNLSVVGFHHGFYTSEDEPKIIAEIKELSPDILLVCTGMPKAEIWADKYKTELNSRLTMCLGGSLDVMAGKAKLAPPFFRKIGMEWLYRLWKQPSRLKRQLDIPRFVIAVILNKIRPKKERKKS